MSQPHTQSSLPDLLRQAMLAPAPGHQEVSASSDSPGSPGSPGAPGSPVRPEIDDEDFTLLAMGRLNQLPPARQRILLARLAADPQLAAQLQHLYETFDTQGLLEPATAPQEIPDPIPHPAKLARSPWAWRFGFAAAACLVLCIGLWRLVDPPLVAGPDGRSFQQPRALGLHSFRAPDYWEQLDRQRLQERLQHDRWRDYALVGSIALCFLLAIPLVVGALRKGKAQPSSHLPGPSQPSSPPPDSPPPPESPPDSPPPPESKPR